MPSSATSSESLDFLSRSSFSSESQHSSTLDLVLAENSTLRAAIAQLEHQLEEAKALTKEKEKKIESFRKRDAGLMQGLKTAIVVLVISIGAMRYWFRWWVI